jgi:hypothetical protein
MKNWTNLTGEKRTQFALNFDQLGVPYRGEWALGRPGMVVLVSDNSLALGGQPGQHAAALPHARRAQRRRRRVSPLPDGRRHCQPLLDRRPVVLGLGGRVGRGDDERVAARDCPPADHDGDGGGRVEAVDVDELAEVELIGEDEVGLGQREHGVDGVRGVGDLDVELTVLGNQVLLVQLRRHDVRHLQHRRPVLAHWLGGAGLHAVEELEEDARRQRRHDRCTAGDHQLIRALETDSQGG